MKVLWELKKEGKADATIKNVGKALNVLAKHCDLDDPESVRTFLATLDRKNGYKKQLAYSYDKYAKIHGLTWNKPKYFVASKMLRFHKRQRSTVSLLEHPRNLQ